MINQELLRGQVVQVNMYNLNRTINSKAVFNQKDMKTAVLLCQLSMDGLLNLTGCAVTAEVLKPDETKVVQKAQIIDAERGLVAIGLTEQCLSAIGTVQCELVVQTENQILYSPKIAYIVVDNLFDLEGVESTDELPILNILISEVLSVQKELSVLETTINTNELIRNTQEEERQVKDVERNSTMEKFKNDFETIQENTNAKIVEIDEEIKRSLVSTNKQVQRVDEKIVEINDRIEVINNTLDTTLEEINTTMEEVSEDVVNKIVEISSKLIEIDNTMNSIVAEFNEKLNYVDKSLSDKLNSVDSSLSSKLTEITNQVNNTLSGYDNKISEVDRKIEEINSTKLLVTTALSEKVEEVDETLNTMVRKVDVKISGYDNKISEVDALVENTINAETNRVQAEQNRATTFNNIVAELEVTQSDIDDILGMVGGL